VFTQATGQYSTALGQASLASGQSSTAVGQNAQATGLYSIAIGADSESLCNGLTAVGHLPDGNPGDCAKTGSTDYVFVVGNGNYENSVRNRRNALVVKRNGNVEIQGDVEIQGNVKMAGHLSINSAMKPWWESPEGTFLYKNGVVYVVTSQGNSKNLATVPIQTHQCPPGTVGCSCWEGNTCQSTLSCDETGICVQSGLLLQGN